jgi:acyl-CoA thioesterase YciA
VTEQDRKPKGHVISRSVAMPAHTNPNGDIFGGWIMSEMDIAAGMLAKQIAGGRVATVSVNSITFLRPVNVGDTVTCYGELERVGRTSMALKIEVWTAGALERIEHEKCVTEATFTFVAIDENGRPTPVKR